VRRTPAFEALGLAALVIAFPLPAATQVASLPAPVVVPLRTLKTAEGRFRPIVAARVVDVEVDLLVDTGGEGSNLSKAFLDHFKDRTESVVTDSNGRRRTYVVGPAELILGKNRIGRFQFNVLGDYLELRDGKELWDASHPMVGMNVLGGFRVRIDGPKGLLTLAPDQGPTEGSGWVNYSGFNGSPHQTIPAKTARGEDVRVFLDTGYEQSRIVRRYAGSKDAPIALSIGDTRVESAGGTVLDGDADLRVTSPGKEDIVTHATLGWDVLRGYVLEISPRNRRLRVIKSE